MGLARHVTAFLLAAGLSSVPAAADAGFRKINSKTEFLEVTQNRAMEILGISVFVTPDGKIGGKAYGRNVSGAWRWQDGYFCRDLFWGERDLGPNCQEVRVDGNRIRFASDRGSGMSAVLTLR